MLVRRKLSSFLIERSSETLIPELLGEIRRAAFRLMRLSSFDAQVFSADLALKLLCTALFGRNVVSKQEERDLSKHIRELENYVTYSLNKKSIASRLLSISKSDILADKITSILNIINDAALRVPNSPIYNYCTQYNSRKYDVFAEIAIRVFVAHHELRAAIALIIYYMATNVKLKSDLAQEADACLSFDGDIDPSKLVSATVSLNYCYKVLRATPCSWKFSDRSDEAPYAEGYFLGSRTTVSVPSKQSVQSPRDWQNMDFLNVLKRYAYKSLVSVVSDFGDDGRLNLEVLELQLLMLDLSAAFELNMVECSPNISATSLVTLHPPSIKLRISFRRMQGEGDERANS